MAPINETIERKARDMLEKACALAQPVDLGRVLDKLELELRVNPMEEEYSGFLVVDKRIIVVNQLHPAVRQRFTIAHEIGHYDMHRSDQDAADVFIDRATYFDNEQEVYFRRNQLSVADYRMEAEANAYAAGLLMPRELLERYIAQHSGKIDLSKSEGIGVIAEEFGVSRIAMGYRLRNLNLMVRTST